MKKLPLLITASLVVCSSVAAYATPIAITQGSLDLKNMLITLSFQGTPGIISSDFTFTGFMGERNPIVGGYDPLVSISSPGSYSLITSQSILTANLNDDEMESLVSISANSKTPGADCSAYFRRNLTVSNLKAISVDLDYTNVIALTADKSGFSAGFILTGLGLDRGSTSLTSATTSLYNDTQNGVDQISSEDGTLKLSYTFSSPFSGLLNLGGVISLTSIAYNYLHAVPEPNAISFILPGLAGLIGAGLIRMRRRTA